MTTGDLPRVREIVAGAQAYLARQGVDQWQDGYPDEAVLLADIALGQGYVLREAGRIRGIVAVQFAPEESYAVIEDGAWTTAEPYACIHRVALDAPGSGLADVLMAAAEDVIRTAGVRSVRIDTHPDNLPMRRMLMRNGYTACGTITLAATSEKGAKRLALEKRL